jgi:uncharacterized protein (DUF983 family)
MKPPLSARARAAFRQRCPRCLEGRVFRGMLDMYERCPVCGYVFGREPGYFTGAMYVSYTLAVPLLALLCLLVWLPTGWSLEWVVGLATLLLLPFVPAIFRYSRVVWMHLDSATGAD